MDFYVEHGIGIACSEKKKEFYAFNIKSADQPPVAFNGTYDDYIARLIPK